MKTAYEHSTIQPDGASWMPGNVIREEHTSAGMGAQNADVKPFEEQRVMAYRSGIDAAQHHFGVKRSSLTQPGTPATNVDAVPAKPKVTRIPDTGTGYATNGAVYGSVPNTTQRA